MTLERPLLLLTWRDSISAGGWQRPSDMQDWAGRIITTVGFLVAENDTDLVVVQSIGTATDEELGCNWLSIPKAVIVSRRLLDTSPGQSGPHKIFTKAPTCYGHHKEFGVAVFCHGCADQVACAEASKRD